MLNISTEDIDKFKDMMGNNDLIGCIYNLAREFIKINQIKIMKEKLRVFKMNRLMRIPQNLLTMLKSYSIILKV